MNHQLREQIQRVIKNSTGSYLVTRNNKHYLVCAVKNSHLHRVVSLHAMPAWEGRTFRSGPLACKLDWMSHYELNRFFNLGVEWRDRELIDAKLRMAPKATVDAVYNLIMQEAERIGKISVLMVDLGGWLK